MVKLIWVTVPNHAIGLKIAQLLVQEKLAACANIIPGLTSIYAWKGKIEEEPEELLMIKTKASLISAVIDRVKSLHPYEVPEIIATPIEQGYPPYLNWIEEETKDQIK